MNVAVEELGACQKKLTIQIDADDVNKQYQSVIQNLRKEITIPGFRKGKASISTIKRRFHRQITDEVKEKLIETSLHDALTEQNIAPVKTPSLDVKNINVAENQPVEYVVDVESWPQFDLKAYKGIEISKKNPPEATEEQIAEQLEALRRQNAIHEPVDDDHLIVDKDSVTIHYQRTLDGEPFGEPAKNVSFWLGVEAVLPELAQHVAGKKKGEQVEFDVHYGDEYADKSLAGKTVHFIVDIVNVEKVVLPELDDEFAKDLEEESLDALKKQLAQNIQAQVEYALVADAKNRLVKKLAEQYDFAVPPSLVADQQKASPDREEAEILSMLRAAIFVARVRDAEDISVSDEELEAEVERMAMQQQAPVATMREFLSKQPNGLERLRSDMQETKAIDFLYEHAIIVEEE